LQQIVCGFPINGKWRGCSGVMMLSATKASMENKGGDAKP
jgi:hypothetical protein